METLTRPAAGRPRDRRIDAAVIAATNELILERGYHRLSLAAVAARASTTTQAIYRRWPGKQELVLEAVFGTAGDEVVADTGDLEADVASMVRWTMRTSGSPAGRAALAGMLGDPGVGTAGASRHLAPLWDRHRANLERWRDSGRIRADVDVSEFIALVAGPAMLLAAVVGASDEATVARLSRLVVEGLAPLDRTVGEVGR